MQRTTTSGGAQREPVPCKTITLPRNHVPTTRIDTQGRFVVEIWTKEDGTPIILKRPVST